MPQRARQLGAVRVPRLVGGGEQDAALLAAGAERNRHRGAGCLGNAQLPADRRQSRHVEGRGGQQIEHDASADTLAGQRVARRMLRDDVQSIVGVELVQPSLVAGQELASALEGKPV